MTADEVCRIIESSAKAGLVELSFDGLVLKRDSQVPVVIPQDGLIYNPLDVLAQQYPFRSGPTPAQLTPEQHASLTKETIERESVMLREEQVQELMLTDPLAYEQAMQNGELEDASGRTDNDS